MSCATLILLIVLFIGGVPGRSDARIGEPEGVARFAVALNASPITDTDGNWQLTVEPLSAQHPENATGTLQLRIGSTATFVEGNPVSRVYPAKPARLHFKLRHLADGPLRVIASLKVPDDDPHSYDYTETAMDLDFRGDSIFIRDRTITEAIAVRDGRRFRYGGEYLVAIDDDEIEPPRQFVSRASVTQSAEVRCGGCVGPDTVLVPILVTIGKGGNVTWIRPEPLDGSKVDDNVWKAVAEGVRRWGFRAAMSSRGPVADYMVLRVRVIPSR